MVSKVFHTYNNNDFLKDQCTKINMYFFYVFSIFFIPDLLILGGKQTCHLNVWVALIEMETKTEKKNKSCGWKKGHH